MKLLMQSLFLNIFTNKGTIVAFYNKIMYNTMDIFSKYESLYWKVKKENKKKIHNKFRRMSLNASRSG